MPTGRVRCLGESPALVSAGAADNPRAYARKGTSTAAEPRLRACVTPVGLHGFVTGAWIVTPGNFREPAFTPVSERRRSRESDGPRVRLAASNRQRYVTVETCFVTVGWGDGEAIGRRKIVVEGSDRARAGPGLGGVGAADVAGVLAGRSDSRGDDAPGGRVAAGIGSAGRCRSRSCGSPAATPLVRPAWAIAWG